MNGARQTLHATVLVVGDAGVLLRGRSGAGKSALALELIARAPLEGAFARLVGDDRVIVTEAGGRIVAQAHPALGGLVEQRFLGLAQVGHEDRAVIRLVVDLVDRDLRRDAPPRAPRPDDAVAEIAGVRLPRMTAPIGDAGAVRLIMGRLQQLSA